MCWKIINFLIFIFLMWFFLQKPLRGFWAQRRIAVDNDLKESRNLFKNAANRNESAKNRISSIARAKEALLMELKEEGEMEKHRIVERADRFSKKLKEDAGRAARHEIAKAKQELKLEMIDRLIKLAAAKVESSIKPYDHKRLADDYVKEIWEERV